MGTPHDVSASVDPSPYRAPRLAAPPSPPRPRWPIALAVTALVAVAASVAVAPRRRAPPPRPAVPGDSGTFDAPVLHASRLVGETFPCALTRVRGGRSQVVCGAARLVTVRGETRGAPRAWYTDPLTALLPASDHRGDELESYDARWAPGAAADVIATGRRADGTWVSFRNNRAAAEPVELPSLGSRGALVELRYAAAIAQWGWCANARGPAAAWVGRAADGSLVALPIEGDGAQLVWRSVLGREADVRAVALEGLTYCAVSGGREVLCGWIPKSAGEEPRAPWRATLLAQLRVDEIALRGRVACARGAAGVRCERWGSEQPRAIEVRAPGLGGEVAAMALGERDLCLADAKHRWWCEGGLDRDDPPPVRALYDATEVRPFVLAHASTLDGAVEVAHVGDGGCARWPSGGVRCWGRVARGRHVWAREGASEVASLRGATAIDVGDESVCALVDARLRCAGRTRASLRGERSGAVPFDIRLPGPARVFGFGGSLVCAGGDGLWCGWAVPPEGPTPASLLPLPSGSAIRSVRVTGLAACVATAAGEAWCASLGYDARGFHRVPALDGAEDFVSRESVLWGMRAGHVLGHFPSDSWRGLPPGSPYEPVGRDGVPPELGAITEGDDESACVLGATGRVACPVPDDAHSRTSLVLVPGVERARLVRGTEHFGCALTQDGAVLCWGSNATGLLTAAEVARTPPLVPLAR
ncbi:MAG: hypothetical protein U0324_26735 [Polyangiales bacterium]